MPRGKELEQLPMANTQAPGVGEDPSPMDREVLTGFIGGERPHPSEIKKETKR
jgi:hypothetical protein